MPRACVIGLVPLLLAASTCGCAVNLWPHTVQSVPTVSGVVTRSGVPVIGAHVHVLTPFRNGQCAPSPYAAVTDGNGAFIIDGDRDLELLLVVGDRIAAWGVCVEEADGTMTEAMRDSSMGYPPAEVELRCDLDRPSVERDNVTGVCEDASDEAVAA